MKKPCKIYSVTGGKEQGHNIHVPASTGIKKGDRLECVILPGNRLMYTLVRKGSE